jgi:hypothetical protein
MTQACRFLACLALTAILGLGCLLGAAKEAAMPLRYKTNPRDPWPKLIMFGVMKPAYLRDHAKEWASYGFRGVLFHIGDWSQEIWAVDGDPSTVGRQDAFFKEVESCNKVGAPFGIDSNFITFAYYRHLPDWFDDAAWRAKAAKYEQTALFARTSGCRGVAVDMEYVAEQYELDWEGNRGHSETSLRAQARKRGFLLVEALLRGFPDMDLLVLPEGPIFYGPLCGEMLGGMIGALAARNAPGGLHLLTEASYTNANVRWLLTYPLRVQNALWPYLSPRARRYWREKCSIALGQWPLSADSEKRDEQGNLVRRPNDKKPNLSVEEFREQTAACRIVSKRYHWIYMHGNAWWSLSPEEAAEYPGSGDSVPPVENISDYRRVSGKGLVFDDQELETIAAMALKGEAARLNRLFGALPAWWVIGPFDNADGKGFRAVYPPERRIDLDAAHRGKFGPVRWKLEKSGPPVGEVNLRSALSRQPWIVAYAVCWVVSDRPQNVQIRLGSDDDAVVWVGSREVWRKEVLRGLLPDQDTVPISLPAGTTPILVKVCQRLGAWGFTVRLTDEAGRPARNLAFTTKPPS